jgi:hypothetical protein
MVQSFFWIATQTSFARNDENKAVNPLFIVYLLKQKPFTFADNT